MNVVAAYSGAITLETKMPVVGDVNILGGALNLNNNDLKTGISGGEELPTAPSALNAIAASSSQVDLSWSDNSHYETGFKIERKTGAGGTYSQIDIVSANVTAYPDTGLTPGTTYYYRIRAYNSAGNSAYSNASHAQDLLYYYFHGRRRCGIVHGPYFCENT